ncbi:MAG TPA: 2,3-bisphosphoglycerate-independent phosphoglycerate mutase, partial [Spirochaetota bacterium]|nr:2,3-bisphosphoglycerate-independent phosphoglycerate mutase [Spirochaetota bacterium]
KTGKPQPKTSHTLNPVPFIIYDPQFNGEYSLTPQTNQGLANVAATICTLLGYNPPEEYYPSLITLAQ